MEPYLAQAHRNGLPDSSVQESLEGTAQYLLSLGVDAAVEANALPGRDIRPSKGPVYPLPLFGSCMELSALKAHHCKCYQSYSGRHGRVQMDMGPLVLVGVSWLPLMSQVPAAPNSQKQVLFTYCRPHIYLEP